MTTALTASGGGWLALAKAAGGLPQPFAREIGLAEFDVAGTEYVDAITAKTDGLKPGEELRLKREPQNGHDAQAIRVDTAAGVKLGYVPRRMNEIPSRLMDAGKLLVARVLLREVQDYYIRLRCELVMKEL